MARKDVLRLARRGVKAMEKDLAETLAGKRTEVTQLADVAASARELAADPDSRYEAEITYEYTARDGSQSFLTKTHSVIVSDAKEALGAAESIERSIPARGKLTDLMIVDLEHRGGELDALKQTLPDFAHSSQALLKEVIANLQ